MSIPKTENNQRKQNSVKINLSEISNNIASHSQSQPCSPRKNTQHLFEDFIYRDQVTFRNIQAKFLLNSKYKKYAHTDYQIHFAQLKTLKNMYLPKSIKSMKNDCYKINQKPKHRKDLTNLKEYINQIKNVKKFRNEQLMKNAEKHCKRLSSNIYKQYKVYKNNKQNEQRIQNQLNPLKKQIQNINKKQIRRYLSQQLKFEDIDLNLFEIQKNLTNYNSHSYQAYNKLLSLLNRQSLKNTISSKKSTKFMQQISQNQISKQCMYVNQLTNFQQSLPKMIRARVIHQSQFNWQKNAPPQLEYKNRKKFFRRSIN